MSDIEETLQQRNIYGSFKEKARFIQQMKYAVRNSSGWTTISYAEREAIDNIMQKLGRVLYGSYHEDNWHDIAGYATLIVKGD